MAWEWELRDTCQASVLYDALGDSMLSWSAADGAPMVSQQNQELLMLGDGRLLCSEHSCCTSPETSFSN